MPKKSAKKSSLPPGRTTPIPGRPDRDRRVRQHDRIARVLNVLILIQSRGRWNVKAIADELKVSQRTVFRDLEVLEFAGVPWYYDDQELCYRVRADFRFPTLGLTDDEAVGQAVATSLSKAAGLALGPGAASTTRKLAARSSEHIQQVLADAERLVNVFDLKFVDHSRHEAVIRTAQTALIHGNLLVGVYESPYEPKPRKLTVHPFRLCFIKATWYLVGRLEGEATAKTFRIARFQSLRALSKTCERPELFDLRAHFGNAWAVYRGAETYAIELTFAPPASRVVTETTWHPTQTTERHRDGSATLRFSVDGLDEILHWLLSWAGRVRVNNPPELRQLFLNTLEQATEQNS